MITFLLGLTLGIIFGVVGFVCVAIMYDKHHPDDQKGERYADKEQKAEKQGFQWPTKNYCRPLPKQHFPDILKFYEDKDVTREAHIGTDSTFYEASELLGTKELSAREFPERIADVSNCCERECIGCVLDNRNNKCNTDLCNTRNWENNIDELLEIAKVGKGTVPTPEEKAIENIEKFIENPDRAALNDEFVESLKLAVEKLKEVE